MEERDFEQQIIDIDRFIGSRHKYLHNKGVTGSRKTTSTIDAISLDCHLNTNHHWVIAVPLHKIIEGEDNIMGWCDKYGLDAVHIYGKNHFPLFEEERCYLKGCSTCPHKESCEYLHQRWDAQILVCAYEIIPTLERFIGDYNPYHHYYNVDEWYGIVIEEEPTRYWLDEINITPELRPYLNIGTETVIKDYWGKGTEYKFCDVTVNDFKPKTIQEKRLYDIGKYNENLKLHVFRDKATLFSHKQYLIPPYFRKVIFNCATTPTSYRNKIFGVEHWVECGIKESISNPVIGIGYKWGREKTIERMDELKQFLSFFEANGKKILLITKQVVEETLDMDIDIVHYGSGRGFNDFNKPYDLIVVYGKYKLPPSERLKLIQLGIMEGEINNLENAEVLQSINRFRPYSHPDTPVILMTQEIADYNDETWTKVGDEILSAYNSFPYTHESQINKNDVTDLYSEYTYYGLDTFVKWVRRWVFKTLSRNQIILLMKISGKTYKQIAARADVSVSTVKRVIKDYLNKHDGKLPRSTKRILELEI